MGLFCFPSTPLVPGQGLENRKPQDTIDKITCQPPKGVALCQGGENRKPRNKRYKITCQPPKGGVSGRSWRSVRVPKTQNPGTIGAHFPLAEFADLGARLAGCRGAENRKVQNKKNKITGHSPKAGCRLGGEGQRVARVRIVYLLPIILFSSPPIKARCNRGETSALGNRTRQRPILARGSPHLP
jgi:hypothetical protein